MEIVNAEHGNLETPERPARETAWTGIYTARSRAALGLAEALGTWPPHSSWEGYPEAQVSPLPQASADDPTRTCQHGEQGVTCTGASPRALGTAHRISSRFARNSSSCGATRGSAPQAPPFPLSWGGGWGMRRKLVPSSSSSPFPPSLGGQVLYAAHLCPPPVVSLGHLQYLRLLGRLVGAPGGLWVAEGRACITSGPGVRGGPRLLSQQRLEGKP